MDKQQVIQILSKEMSHYRNDKMYLFGSFAYGQPNDYSDIDLLVISEENHQIRFRQLLRAFSEYPIDFDVLVYSPEQVKEKEKWNPFIQKILTEGIQING